METKIDIRQMVASVIMEEVNNLGVRAAVKEKLNEVGQFTRDDVRKLILDVADSYIRSMNVEAVVNQLIDEIVTKKIKETVEYALREYITGSPFSPSLTKDLRQIVIDQVKIQLDSEYDLRIVNRKTERLN